MSSHQHKRARTDADRETQAKVDDDTTELRHHKKMLLHSSANKVTNKVRRFQEKVNELNLKNQSLQDENNQLRDQIDKLEKELQKKQDTENSINKSQEAEIETLRTQIQNLINSKTKDSEKYKFHIENLQSELNKAKDENKKLRSEVRVLSDSYKKATTKQKNENLDFILKMEVKMDEVKAELEKQRDQIKNEMTVQDDSQQPTVEELAKKTLLGRKNFELSGSHPTKVENASDGTTNTSKSSRKDRNSERALNVTRDRASVSLGNSQKNHTFQVPEEYCIEIQRRVKEEYKVALSNINVPNLYNWNAVCETEKGCHICHARKPNGVMFSCGQHFYCESHVQARLNVSGKEFCSDPEKYDFCPVCCFTCVCSKCLRTLNSVAGELQMKCIEVGKKPIEIKYDVLSIASGFTWSEGGLTKNNLSQEKMSRVTKLPIIPRSKTITSPKYKIPKEAFPYEVFKDRDIDPSSNNDYSFVWDESGKIGVLETYDQPRYASSIDYCMKCDLGGDLICCDKCPRSFHAKCIEACASTLPDTWLCTDCIKDNRFDESTDLVEGEYNRAIFKQFSLIERSMTGKIDLAKKMKTSYKVYEIVSKLINYDFGNVFASPVDVRAIPNYLDWVTNPMDLGTVRDRIIYGDYVEQVFDNIKDGENMNKEQFENLFEELIFIIFKDIETIWHNCFMYNEVGSMYHRMALVQRKKFMMLRKHNIDSDLAEETKERLLKVVQDFSDERLSRLKGRSKISNFSANISDPRTGTFAHIFDASQHSLCPPATDIVAVFDPDTHVIAKMYNSQCSAASAAMNLYERGFPCELEGDFSKKTFIDFMKKNKNDSTLTCFGYRWLYYTK